ncbi:MAG: orotate phosphoribosyltransferase [Alphaproteobacteria bacterium]|nr:orotate phosphoribosyltransferase [Alphaproteobacteria bacterium]
MSPDEIAQTTARILIETRAIQFNATKPYIFASGLASPTYCNCRKLISFPRARKKLMDMAMTTIERAVGFTGIDAVAGGETAGIPYAAWIAERLDLPMLYVRKKPKGYGMNALIEGDLHEGQNVLLVEDLATDGKSKMHFVNGLRQAGAKVAHAFVVFHYGIFPDTIPGLKAEGVDLHALATWWDVLKETERQKAYSAADLAEVRKFLEAPVAWSAAHGGIGADGMKKQA